MRQDVLSGGVLRLSAPSITFLYQRLEPAVLLSASRGLDTGELGSAPLAVIERECKLFGRPVYWYLDAAEVENAARSVSEQWTAWLRAKADTLAHLHVLAENHAANLTINIARHFSERESRMTVYSDREVWNRRVLRQIPELTTVPDLAGRFDETAVNVSRAAAPTAVILTRRGCTWTFKTISPNALMSEFAGSDTGELTDLALDEVASAVARSNGPLRWFMDLRKADNVAPEVSRVWTEWLTVNRERFARIAVLASSPLFPLVFTVASYRSRMESLVHVYREPDPFWAEVASACVSRRLQTNGRPRP